MSRMLYLLTCVLVAMLFVFIAMPARSIKRMEIPEVGTVFVWSEDEMDRLEAALDKLVAERNALKRRVEQLGKSCT